MRHEALLKGEESSPKSTLPWPGEPLTAAEGVHRPLVASLEVDAVALVLWWMYTGKSDTQLVGSSLCLCITGKHICKHDYVLPLNFTSGY